MIEGNSLIDLDDGTTISFHTAKESRLDHQSTLSVGSDDTNSTLHQPSMHDDFNNTIMSPEETFFFDAMTSPLQNHHMDKTYSTSIENLKNIMADIHALSDDQYEENPHDIHRLISIVDDIHHYHEITPSKNPATDNLLFIYDQINDNEGEQSETPNALIHLEDQPTTCVNNLLFFYDETLTPIDEQTKPIGHESDEWSYDNLLMDDQREDISTDHLGTIVHEALVARFQKPIRIKSMEDLSPPTDHLGTMMHQVLSVRSPTITDESPVETDHLGMIVHEALAARFQKRIDFQSDHVDQSSPVETDNLGTIIHEALAARFQKPIRIKSMEDLPPTTDHLATMIHQVLSVRSPKIADERPVETDNLGTIVHESLAARFQKPIQMKVDEEPIDEGVYHVEHSPEGSDTQEMDDIIDPLEIPDEDDRVEPYASIVEETPIEESETFVVEIEHVNDRYDQPSVDHLSHIVNDSNYRTHREETEKTFQVNITERPLYDEEIYEEYGYRRTVTGSQSDDIVEKFEELCRRYTNTVDQYQNTAETIDKNLNEFEAQFQQAENEYRASPISETTSEELITTIERVVDMRNDQDRDVDRHESDDYCVTIDVQRQADGMGQYGFGLKEEIEGKIQVASIDDPISCSTLSINDEIVSINNDRTFQTLEQCQDLLDALWESSSEHVQITVIKSVHIPILPSK